MDTPRIKIFCRSFSKELYALSRGLYEQLGWPTVRLTDQSADGYFYTMLKDTECDIAINIDEDAFLIDPMALKDLIEKVITEGYANAGCPDGGSGCPRGGNPIVTNPFFNVFNLKLIRSKFTGKEQIRRFDIPTHLQQMALDFPAREKLRGEYTFERYEYEPYYPFFFWLAWNFKTLYLMGEVHQDGFSTILKDTSGRTLCLHSWLARFYTAPSWAVRHFQPGQGNQKQRIDSLIDEAYAARKLARPAFSAMDRANFTADKCIRWCIKVPQRICGWPRKLRRKLRKLR